MALEIPRPKSLYPSTTRILDFFGFYAGLEKAKYSDLEAAKLRGQAVDKWVTWLAMADPNTPHLRAETEAILQPYDLGFRTFLHEHDWEHEAHQREFVSHVNKFVSHPDLLGRLDGFKSVLEVKTGAWPDSVRLQTAGQIIAEGNFQRRRYVIWLPGDGTYRLRHLFETEDFDDFTILVRCYHTLHRRLRAPRVKNAGIVMGEPEEDDRGDPWRQSDR